MKMEKIYEKNTENNSVYSGSLRSGYCFKNTFARTGFIHIAFSIGSKEKVYEITALLKLDGYEVSSSSCMTGDRYCESCVYYCEGNRLINK